MNQTQCVAQPRFSAGSRVRVKSGVTDPDLPDLHLGDWTGTVAQVETGSLTAYLIRWSRNTLRTVPPALREYCEKEDAALDEMWLLEEDLEPGPKAPSPLKGRAHASPDGLDGCSRRN
jgi:hypothetical protein